MIPKPFPKDEFVPLERTHILATLDVCPNKAISTHVWAKEGFDQIPICMIRVTRIEEEKQKKIPLKILEDEEISFQDKQSSKKEHIPSETCYDASLKPSEDKEKLKFMTSKK